MEELNIIKTKKLIYISNNLSQRERLVLNYCINLIRLTKTNIKGYYITSLYSISKTLKIKDYKNIKNILEKFISITLHINILKEVETIASLLSQMNHIKDKGILELKFSDAFVGLALEEKRYTKIDLNIQTKLKSKYSLIIYEMIMDYTIPNNKYIFIPHLDINTFKSLMGFSDNRYISKAHIKRDILEKAKTDLAKNANIVLKYRQFEKMGIDFVELKFDSVFNLKEEVELIYGVPV